MGCGASTPKDGGVKTEAKQTIPKTAAPSDKPPRPSEADRPSSAKAAPEAPVEPPTLTKLTSTQCAISLSWLATFAAELADSETTSNAVAVQLMAQAAAAVAAKAKPGDVVQFDSFAEVLLSRGGADADAVAKGRTYHYVIHARSRPFAETVAMLRRHFVAETQQAVKRRAHGSQHGGHVFDGLNVPDVYVWLDTVSSDKSTGGGVGGTVSASGGIGDAAAELAAVREVVEAAESVLLVLDDNGTALSELGCLYGIWLAGATGRPLRVLTYEVDFEALRHVIADLDIASVAASDSATPKRLREDVLQVLVGAGSTAAASRAARDALVNSILTEAKEDPLRQQCSEEAVTEESAAPPDPIDADRRISSDDADDGVGGGAAARRSSGGGAAAAANLSAAAIFRLDRAARMLEVLGRMAEAEVLFRRVLSATEQALGTDHPDTLTSAANLASLLHDGGKLAEAEPLLRRVLSAHTRALGVTHHETAASLEALGLLLEQQGRLDEAEAAFRRSLAAYEGALGPESREALTAVGNLAHVLMRGEGAALEEAEALYRRALSGHEATLGSDHHDTLGSVNNLAMALKTAGKLEDAEELYRRALEGCERGKGPDHPDTFSATDNLAALLQARGDLERAEPLFRRALAGREAVLGESHPDTLGSVNNLAVLLQAQGQYGEAEMLFRRALAGWETALGVDHPDTLTSAWNLGVVVEAQGRPEEALEIYQREAEGRVRRGDAARAEQRQEHIRRLQAQIAGAA